MSERIYTRYEQGLLQAVQEAEKTAILLLRFILRFNAVTGEKITEQKSGS